MNKRNVKLDLGSDANIRTVRYKTFLEDTVTCISGTFEYYHAQRNFISNLFNNPDLLKCDTLPFESLRVYHNGERWIAEMEATQQEER